MADFNDFSPVRKADLPDGAAEAPAPPPRSTSAVPTFAAGKPRERRIELDYPIEYDGRLYEAVTLRRPTSVEVGQFFEALLDTKKMDSGAVLQFPIFVDDEGAPIPAAVIGYLDSDDEEVVMGAVEYFLPRRFQRVQDAMQSASRPPVGEHTGPTSST